MIQTTTQTIRIIHFSLLDLSAKDPRILLSPNLEYPFVSSGIVRTMRPRRRYRFSFMNWLYRQLIDDGDYERTDGCFRLQSHRDSGYQVVQFFKPLERQELSTTLLSQNEYLVKRLRDDSLPQAKRKIIALIPEEDFESVLADSALPHIWNTTSRTPRKERIIASYCEIHIDLTETLANNSREAVYAQLMSFLRYPSVGVIYYP